MDAWEVRCCILKTLGCSTLGNGYVGIVTWLEALKVADARPQRAPRTSTSGSSNMLCSSYSGTLKAGDAPKPA